MGNDKPVGENPSNSETQQGLGPPGVGPNRTSNCRMSKMPTHDGSEMIELYLDRLETWFDLEGVTSEEEKLRHVLPFLPPAMFVEVKQAKVREHPFPYEQMKKVLKQAFAREEAARVRELTANVKLGNRKPGDLLRDMQQLAATTDERMLKNLWLQQLPVELGAALATSRDLPITQLRDMANTIHGFMNERDVNQVAALTTPCPPAPSGTVVSPPPAPPAPSQQQLIPGLTELVNSIGQMMTMMRSQHEATISAIERRTDGPRGRARSGQRDSFRGFRNRSLSRDSEVEFDDQGRCWYHRTYGNQARKCRPGCSLGGVRQ